MKTKRNFFSKRMNNKKKITRNNKRKYKGGSSIYEPESIYNTLDPAEIYSNEARVLFNELNKCKENLRICEQELVKYKQISLECEENNKELNRKIERMTVKGTIYTEPLSDEELEEDESGDTITYQGIEYTIDLRDNTVYDDELQEIGVWDGRNVKFINAATANIHLSKYHKTPAYLIKKLKQEKAKYKIIEEENKELREENKALHEEEGALREQIATVLSYLDQVMPESRNPGLREGFVRSPAPTPSPRHGQGRYKDDPVAELFRALDDDSQGHYNK